MALSKVSTHVYFREESGGGVRSLGVCTMTMTTDDTIRLTTVDPGEKCDCCGTGFGRAILFRALVPMTFHIRGYTAAQTASRVFVVCEACVRLAVTRF